MAKSFEALKQQQDKIKRVQETITPPTPSDEFEALRAEVLKHMSKLDNFLVGQITGDGSVSIPEAEPER